MEASQLPSYPSGGIDGMNLDTPYPGLESVPGPIPPDLFTTFPPHCPAYFSTRRGKLPVRFPNYTSLNVARSDYNADIFYTAEKYEKHFPEVVSQIEALPSCWQDLYEYFDPMDLWVEGAGFLYHVLHRLSWNSLMKRRRLTSLVETWCLRNIPKLASQPALAPVSHLLDNLDWHYFGFDTISKHDIELTCQMLDRQAYDMRPIIQLYTDDSALSSKSIMPQQVCQSPSQEPAMPDGSLDLGGAEKEQTATLDMKTPGFIPNSLHQITEIPQGDAQSTQRSANALHNGDAFKETSKLRPEPLSGPNQATQLTSSGYSLTGTLAELRDETESSVPRVALPGQVYRATTPPKDETFDLEKLRDDGADWTIAATEKRLIGIRIADSYDTAKILKSDLIPRVMSTCGKIESYRPQISDARLTFVSSASAQAALKFNGRTLDNGPKLIVYLVPNWEPPTKVPNSSGVLYDTGTGAVPPDANLNNSFSTQPVVLPGRFAGAAWATAPIFTPQSGTAYAYVAEWRGDRRAARPVPRIPSSGPPVPANNLATQRMPSALQDRNATVTVAVGYGFTSQSRTPPRGPRIGSFHVSRNSPGHITGHVSQSQNQSGSHARNCNQQSIPTNSVTFQDKRALNSGVLGQGGHLCQVTETSAIASGVDTQPLPQSNDTTINKNVAAQENSTASDGVGTLETAPSFTQGPGRASQWQGTVVSISPSDNAGQPSIGKQTSSTPLPSSKPTDGQGRDDKCSNTVDPMGSSSNKRLPDGENIPLASYYPKHAKRCPAITDPSLSDDARNHARSDFGAPSERAANPFRHSQHGSLAVRMMSESARNIGNNTLSGFVAGSQQTCAPPALSMPPVPTISDSDDVEVISVPGALVPWIVGRRGSRIRKLKLESGCYMKMASPDPTKSMQECRLQGSASARAVARAMLNRLVVDAGSSPTFTFEREPFFVEASIADLVIQRHSASVARIEALTGVAIELEGPNERGLPLRRCLITGLSASGRYLAHGEMQCIIHNMRVEASHGAIGIEDFQVATSLYRNIRSDILDNHQHKENDIRELVRIEDVTGCRFHFLLNDEPGKLSQLCQIIGPREQLAGAKNQFDKSFGNYITGWNSDTFTIQEQAIALVEGANRERLQALEQRSGCKVHFDGQKNPNSWLVVVTGPILSRQVAMAEIRRIMDELPSQSSSNSISDEVGLQRILQSVTAPQTEHSPPILLPHPKSQTSMRLEQIEYPKSGQAESREESKSVAEEVEVSEEDIRRSAAYTIKPWGAINSAANPAIPGAADFKTLEARAKKTANAAKRSKAAAEMREGAGAISAASTEHFMENDQDSTRTGQRRNLQKRQLKAASKMPRQDSTASEASGGESGHNYKPSFKKTVDESGLSNSIIDTPNEDSILSEASADGRSKGLKKFRPWRKGSKEKRPRTPNTLSTQDNTLFLPSAASADGTQALARKKGLTAPELSRQKSTASLPSRGGLGESSSLAKKASVPKKHYKDHVESAEGESILSQNSGAESAQGTSHSGIDPTDSAADTQKAAVRARSTSPLRKPQIDHKENVKEERGRRPNPNIGNVLDHPHEWPTLSGGPTAPSSRSLSPETNDRVLPDRRDSMAAIVGAGGAPAPMPALCPVIAQPQLGNDPTIEYVDHGLRAASTSTVNSDVTVVMADKVAESQDWPTVVAWNGKNEGIEADVWEVGDKENVAGMKSAEQHDDEEKLQGKWMKATVEDVPEEG